MQEKVAYPNQPNGHANGDVFSSQDKKALEANGLLGSALEKSLEANGHLISIQDKKAAEANGDAGVHKRVSIFMGDVEIEEDDPWALPELKDDTAKWKDLDTKGKIKRVTWLVTRFVVLIGLMYMFICSLDFLGSAFQLLGGKAAGQAMSSSVLLSNPVAGLMVGVLATVLVQSSSTSTSIIVSMVSADILQVKLAIPIAMGCNIGTTVTNTLVSLGQLNVKSDFRRAFAAATVHDMFNWLCVLVLLPLEVASDYLFLLTEAITSELAHNRSDTASNTNPKMLKAITEPFTSKIIQLSSSKIRAIARGEDVNGSIIVSGDHLFNNWTGSDSIAGVILLVVSLIILCVCLVLVVKILSSLLRGAIAKVLQRVVNADFPGPFKYVTGYFVILVGAGLTIIVQSSSIFTSALTPLVGVGAIHLDRMYPLTIGSNIGTTITGILAALTSSQSTFRESLQIALCHLFFNVSGVILLYVVPVTRKLPLNLAKFLGQTVHQYRWFAVVYLIIVFFLFPLAIFGLSVAGWEVLVGVGAPVVLLLIFVIVVNILQKKAQHCLPKRLQNWETSGIPEPLRSLRPYDKIFVKLSACCQVCSKKEAEKEANEKEAAVGNGHCNDGFEGDLNGSMTSEEFKITNSRTELTKF
ncbi:sodium-dependent phosphate transport protein 2B-like [Biomphalaria glabrata]|uniref:Sodium-dependent phosphate transport protein 2B-like n=1 Tax=Biomphalaria glabrata TaxID=6526 RepID=A0A9W3AYH8_BIOGL|nr:sodium-dependent phosphate transport protein 2B-like [Biomphalaria glabrata]